MLMSRPFVGWLCVAVLSALAARSLARLAADRTAAGCARTSRVGEASHAAMALGMAAMAAVSAADAPAAVSPSAFEVYFAALAAFAGGAWLVRPVRRAAARRRGSDAPCRPAHALEPHHAAVALAMVVMAAQMRPHGGAAGGAMASMPGMAAASGSAAGNGLGAGLGVLALAYVWAAVVVLGLGLARSAIPPTPSAPGGLALLGAPATVYACELTMTVVMGLMLLG